MKVIQEWDATHDRMLQSGLLGDESGTVKFVMWKEEGKEKLAPDSVYNIYYALVDEFNGRYSLNLNTATIVPEEGDITVTSGSVAIQGVLVAYGTRFRYHQTLHAGRMQPCAVTPELLPCP